MKTIKQFEQINTAIRDSEWNRDKEKYLERILAPDLLFRRANGVVVEKEAYLTALADVNNIFSHLENISIESTINDTEDKAISIVVLQAAGTRNKKPFFGVFKNIRIFRKNPEWELYVWYNEEVK